MTVKSLQQLIRLTILVFVLMLVIVVFRSKPETPLRETPKQISDLKNSVSQHKTQNDCWMIIEGQVYDITKYFGQHPGGDKLMVKYCGLDATEGWKTKDRAVAKLHSVVAQTLLKNYLIQ